MNPDRYIIINPTTDNEISQLDYTIDEFNYVTVTWQWPAAQNLALVFELDATTERPGSNKTDLNGADSTNPTPAAITLPDLLAAAAPHKIITKSLDVNYKAPLTFSRTRFAVFPADFNDDNDGDDIIAINQTTNNITNIITKQDTIPYRITEKTNILKPTKTIEIIFEQTDLPAEYFYYAVNGKKYPVSYDGHTITLPKAQTISIQVVDEMADTIRLTKIE